MLCIEPLVREECLQLNQIAAMEASEVLEICTGVIKKATVTLMVGYTGEDCDAICRQKGYFNKH